MYQISPRVVLCTTLKENMSLSLIVESHEFRVLGGDVTAVGFFLFLALLGPVLTISFSHPYEGRYILQKRESGEY